MSEFDSEEEDISEGDMFSEDSDDDRTWAPTPSKSSGDKRRSGRVAPVKRDIMKPDKKKKKNKTPKEPKLPKEKKQEKKKPKKKNNKLDSLEEDKDALIDGGGDNLHYFCKLCQITFYKHSSYKQHMRTGKKTHAEIEARNKGEEYECSDCCIAFMDKKAQIKHMADFHKNPFYCAKCDVQLKSESSFKSHNSKLHLERREKTYYCRECDETFSCWVKQQKHIKTHRLWSGQDPGMQVNFASKLMTNEYQGIQSNPFFLLQCQNCGKVFTSSQVQAYNRHMATHEFETGDVSLHASIFLFIDL